jgi:Tfp pilus assembly protein PilX
VNGRFRNQDDSGSALLFAVIVVFVVMLVVTSMLSLSAGNMRATAEYKDQAGTTSVADGAAQTAANTVRQTLFNNSAGQHCFPDALGSLSGGSDTLQLDDFAVQGGQHYSAAVACTHSGGSSSPVLISASNRPGMAILTTGDLAAQGEDGLSIKALNAVPFKVHGLIYSNSNVKMVSGSLLDDNGVYAKGACTGAGTVTPAPICSFSGGTPSGADPAYVQPTALPNYQAVPFAAQSFPNSCKNSVITFDPGYYDDAKSLSTLMSNSGCAGSTFWFKPGLYYFDFHNGDDPALPPGSHAWTVNTGALVAGTPVSPAGTTLAQPPLPGSLTVPGSCRNPITSNTALGVQFVFGGDSQFVVDAAKVEMCGTYSTSSPPIALYGATSGAEPQTMASGLHMTTGSGSGDFTTPNGMQIAGDGSLATWTNNSAGTRTGASTVTGSIPAPSPSPGTHLDAGALTVVHGNSAGDRRDNLTVTFRSGTSQSVVTVPSYSDNVMHTDIIDLKVDPTFPGFLHGNGLGALDMTYSATVKHKGVETVDGITLDLTYRLPAYRSENSVVAGGNCLALPYTGGGGSGCAALTSTQAPGNQFYIQGTAYAPRAAFDVSLNQATSQVFKFGVVARSLPIKVTGSSTFSQPVIEIPDDSPGSVVSTNVILSAYVCPTTSGCAASGTPALKARVALIDPDPGAVIAGLRALNIQSWSTPGRSGG